MSRDLPEGTMDSPAEQLQKALDDSAEQGDPASLLPLLAQNLRRLRTRKGFSLERLARASGVSRAMLGQIELEKSVPTVNVLWRVASALGIPFGALLGTAAHAPTAVLRRREAARLTNADGSFASRPLFPFGQGPRSAEFYELRLLPRAVQHAAPHPPGSTENLVVSAGTLALEVGAERHQLESGDAIVFRADVAHCYRNAGQDELVLYLVVSYALDRG